MLRRPAHDFVDVALVVEIEAMHDAEARAQRSRKQTRARGRANQRELLQRYLHRSRARALADDDVELVVLHRRIEDFLDRGRHAVNLVDEQHLVRLQVRQHRREIARLLDDRTRGRAHGDAHLVADDIGERRLAEPGRPIEENVIERFVPAAGRRDRHREVVAHAVLTDVFVEESWTKARFVLRVFVKTAPDDQPIPRHVLLTFDRLVCLWSLSSLPHQLLAVLP